jgi:hypothetical protein
MVDKGEVNLKAGSEFMKQWLVKNVRHFILFKNILKCEETPNTVSQ